jgi:hypothetical protein
LHLNSSLRTKLRQRNALAVQRIQKASQSGHLPQSELAVATLAHRHQRREQRRFVVLGCRQSNQTRHQVRGRRRRLASFEDDP